MATTCESPCRCPRCLSSWLSIRMANSTSASRDPGSSRIASSSRISTFSRRGGRAESLKALSAAKMRNSTQSFATLRTPCLRALKRPPAGRRSFASLRSISRRRYKCGSPSPIRRSPRLGPHHEGSRSGGDKEEKHEEEEEEEEEEDEEEVEALKFQLAFLTWTLDESHIFPAMASSQEQSTKVMEVTVRSQGCNDRTKHLRITMGLQPSTSDPQKHDLLVTLADDTDRSFLFACRLCQEDFPSLKERYGLHAQFGSFPEALMKAFGKCGSKQSSSESRYELVLSSDSPSLDGSAELSLMKTDEFASGTILSLPFTRAKVEEVKEEYVGDLVTLLQAETERLQVQLAKTQEDLEQVQTRLEERIQHQSVVQRTVMRQHHQLTSTVGVRLEHVLDCLRLPSHETSWVRRMVLTLKRRFTAVHSRQKTELRLLFQEQ
ncbi:uncharacterized protein LOC144079031 [Stigmatopora argus]